MDQQIRDALQRDRTIDITTTGRKSGEPRRLEIWFHNLDGEIYITGTPGTRDWYANLVANPKFTFHLTQSVRADLPAQATPVVDPQQRRDILSRIVQRVGRPAADVDAWVARSPLVRVELLDQPA